MNELTLLRLKKIHDLMASGRINVARIELERLIGMYNQLPRDRSWD